MIIFHLRENDLGTCKGIDFIMGAKRDLGRFKIFFPVGLQLFGVKWCSGRVW